jgi:hypothetical protein
MKFKSIKNKYFRKHIALPGDHGSWVFLLSPWLIGSSISGIWTPASGDLLMTLLAAFLLRQPATIAVKAYSGRRSKEDLPAARFWFFIYAFVGGFGLSKLVWEGYGFLLPLAIPGILVFIWHLWLVSKRAERYQMGIDLIASGALALAAPAALWVGLGESHPNGWWLWGLSWLQSAASILYAFLRLEQRKLKQSPDNMLKWRMAWRALLYSTFNLVAVISLSLTSLLPLFLWIPYALQWVEVIWGTIKPAIGYKPTRIGLRQLVVSTLFTILFVLVWKI